MKSVSIKFEQVASRTITLVKAVKDNDGKVISKAITEKEYTLISAKTKGFDVKDNSTTVATVIEIVSNIQGAVNYAQQMECKKFNLGGSNFMINKPFNLYVCIDGVDFCLNDVNNFTNILGLNVEGSFRLSKLEILAKGLYSIMQVAKNESPLLTATASTSLKLTK
jgi:hypothetical protein